MRIGSLIVILTVMVCGLSAQERVLAKISPQELARTGMVGEEVIPGWSLVRTNDTAATRSQLEAIGVYSELDRKIELQFSVVLGDSLYELQWGLTGNSGMWNGNFEEAWAVTTGSDAVKVGIIDSGIPKKGRWEQPDIDSTRIVSSISYVESFSPNDSDATDSDFLGHATHILGIVGATSDNGIGVKGIDQKARITSYKAFTQWGYGWNSWVANAIYRAAYDGCQVINMSFGSAFYSKTMEEAIAYAAGVKKVVCVVAAGNWSEEIPSFPAFFGKFSTRFGYREGFPTVITVGSIDKNGNMSRFSNRGWFVDLYAPGGWGSVYKPEPPDTGGGGGKGSLGYSFVDERNVLSTIPLYPTRLGPQASDSTVVPGYGYLAGTSMAAPFVVGTVALMFAANPALPPEKVRDILVATADSIPSLDGVTIILNPGRAVKAARDYFPTFVEGSDNELPHRLGLFQNYPNPFNPATTISFDLPKAGFVELKVFNLLGEEVATLMRGEQASGTHTASFDATKLASGVYVYRLNAGGMVLTRKMLFMK
ncbi:MAG: S8/S53 family peptidase [Candidatus Jorgensenbacteria bacterium]|nr:S8/S53 family peptidase [Candidatus Jorgensenbacteria bacterium]